MRKGAVWLVVAAVLGVSACGADDDDAGTGGSSPGGSGGTTAGTSGAAGSMGGLTGACAGANVAVGPAALHAAAQVALAGPMASCGLSTACHQGATGKAMLSFKDKPDMRMLMVGKMSCVAPTIPLVDGRGGEAALNNSWLYLKLIAPLDSASNLMANTAFGTPGSCGQITVGSFGQRMPQGETGMWKDTGKIRDWICGGAPGP